MGLNVAKKVTVTFVDDIDNRNLADETVEFGIDGVAFEIDLSTSNAARLRSEMDGWVEHARRVGGRERAKGVATSTLVDRGQAAVIRDWARRNGHGVSARGRLSGELVELYNAAH